MQYQLNIPKIEVTLEAKDKNGAIKEARRVIDVLLKKQEYWREVVGCLSTHGAAGYAPGSVVLPDGKVRCVCGMIIAAPRKEAIRPDMLQQKEE